MTPRAPDAQKRARLGWATVRMARHCTELLPWKIVTPQTISDESGRSPTTYQIPMPAQQGLGLREESPQTRAVKEPTQCGEQCPVAESQRWGDHLSANERGSFGHAYESTSETRCPLMLVATSASLRQGIQLLYSSPISHSLRLPLVLIQARQRRLA